MLDKLLAYSLSKFSVIKLYLIKSFSLDFSSNLLLFFSNLNFFSSLSKLSNSSSVIPSFYY